MSAEKALEVYPPPGKSSTHSLPPAGDDGASALAKAFAARASAPPSPPLNPSHSVQSVSSPEKNPENCCRKGEVETPVDASKQPPSLTSCSSVEPSTAAQHPPPASSASRRQFHTPPDQEEACEHPFSGEFDELPLMLLRSSCESASTGGPCVTPPASAQPPVGEEWRQGVSACVAAAFRDLQGSMHLRTSNSRAMRIGLEEALHVENSLEMVGSLPASPRRHAKEKAERKGANAGAKALGRSVSATPSDSPSAGPPGGSTDAGVKGLPARASSGSQREQTDHNTSDEEILEGGALETKDDLQTEFLSAYAISAHRVAAIAEAAEAAAEEGAAAAATVKLKAAAMPRSSTSCLSTASLRQAGAAGSGHATPQSPPVQGPVANPRPVDSPAQASPCRPLNTTV
ncbi:uncharacterized protein LOC34624080 [Cyclospora cayetanensis]|uniref:Uncharacterized protein LOC34624080 n=1 Tax=Cyclospora cayetanensis TaxID=88456 RepID=A0A6P6RYK2_9EIME|nr:uncharacterized protein LOC34624080 [Cyclospora cayetanensis]